MNIERLDRIADIVFEDTGEGGCAQVCTLSGREKHIGFERVVFADDGRYLLIEGANGSYKNKIPHIVQDPNGLVVRYFAGHSLILKRTE